MAAAAGGGCDCGGLQRTAFVLDASHGTLWVSDEQGPWVLVLDAADGGLLAELVTTTAADGGRGASVAASRDGEQVYVANEGAGVVAAFRPRALEAPTLIDGLVRPRVVRPSADGRWLYVSQAASHQLAVVDLQSLEVGRVDAGGTPTTSRTQAVWSTEQGEVYVVNQLANTLVWVDPAAGGPRWSLPVATTPAGLVATRTGEVGYLTGSRDDVVQRVRLRGEGAPDAGPTARVGDAPGWISLSQDDRWLVVSNTGVDNTISIIDLQQGFQEQARVVVGIGRVRDHALSPDGALAYVAVGLPPEVVAVDLQRRQVVARYQARGLPRGVAFVPPLAREIPPL
jgi:DNA-binding beta-propeller fold protein YncE